MKPVRLLDDPTSSGVERALLEAGRHHTPIAYDAVAGADRLRVNLAAAAMAGVASTAAVRAADGTGVLGRLVAKLGAKLTVSIVIPTAALGVAATTTIAHYAATSPPVASTTAAPPPPRAPLSPEATAAVVAPDVRRVPELPEGEAAQPEAEPPAPATDVVRREPHARIGASVVSPMVASRATPSTASRRPELAENTPVPSMRVHLEETPEADEAPRRETPAAPAHIDRSAGVPQAKGRATAPDVAPTTPAASEAAAEMRGIAAARNLLGSDPNAALAALARVQKEHPRGFFVEERRALTVLAIARAGNKALAREKAQAFVRAYPNGPFTDKVRAAGGL